MGAITMKRDLLRLLSLACVMLASSTGAAQEPTLKQLKKAMTRVGVEGVVLTLEARLWRDSPTTPPAEDAPLAGALKLMTADGNRVPVAMKVDRVWVVRGKEIWAPAEHEDELEAKEPGAPPSAMSITIKGGPKWKLGTKVFCVVRIVMTDGSEGLIRVAGVAVGAKP
jgi:hypothetical protein